LFIFTNLSVKNKSLDLAMSSIKLGDNFHQVETLLRAKCPDLIKETIDPLRFPLAKIQEQHITCHGLIGDGDIAVTLADNKALNIRIK